MSKNKARQVSLNDPDVSPQATPRSAYSSIVVMIEPVMARRTDEAQQRLAAEKWASLGLSRTQTQSNL